MTANIKTAIQPYLHFQDNCKEAMQFYHKLFGGNLEIMTIGDSPEKDQFPEDLYTQVMHACLVNGELIIMASDMCGQGEINQGNSVQLNINCNSKEEIQTLYEKLSEKGNIIQKLEKQFWGSLFAMVIDRFGVRWMLSFDEK